ncbi:hypothetical protein Leryth_002880 [Lithospermum erythrorhizon]|nr:hypothetical protein Leryth_002880 [Lithospermum erythrorhizon]
METSRKRRRLTWDDAPVEQPQGDNEEVDRVRKAQFSCQHVSPPKRDDDREGHYTIASAVGTFGRVLECWDREKREHVAVKVIRSIRKYRDAAMIEIDVLQHLVKNNNGESHCVQIQNWFDYRNHICIDEGMRLLVICMGKVTITLQHNKHFLPFISMVLPDMHDLRLIHTDLKPENILLESSEYVKLPGRKNISDETNSRCLPKSSAIKLIDFGSTTFDNQSRSSIVSTRHYRAPEIILGAEESRGLLKEYDWDKNDQSHLDYNCVDNICLFSNVPYFACGLVFMEFENIPLPVALGLGWSYPCDIWSVGCILVELCLGKALFQTHENLEHMAMMERVLGPLPEHMIQRANREADKYFRRSRLDWPGGAVSRESIRAVKKLDYLKKMISKNVQSSLNPLDELLHGLLQFDPLKRLTAKQALEHPFFKNPI